MALGLPKYTIEAKKHCYDSKKKEFANFEDAEKECSNDKTCGGIWNEKCEGARFFTCEIGQDWLEISSKSCVLTKTQGKENACNTFKILIVCAKNYVVKIPDHFTKYSSLLKILFRRQR